MASRSRAPNPRRVRLPTAQHDDGPNQMWCRRRRWRPTSPVIGRLYLHRPRPGQRRQALAALTSRQRHCSGDREYVMRAPVLHAPSPFNIQWRTGSAQISTTMCVYTAVRLLLSWFFTVGSIGATSGGQRSDAVPFDERSRPPRQLWRIWSFRMRISEPLCSGCYSRVRPNCYRINTGWRCFEKTHRTLMIRSRGQMAITVIVNYQYYRDCCVTLNSFRVPSTTVVSGRRIFFGFEVCSKSESTKTNLTASH